MTEQVRYAYGGGGGGGSCSVFRWASVFVCAELHRIVPTRNASLCTTHVSNKILRPDNLVAYLSEGKIPTRTLTSQSRRAIPTGVKLAVPLVVDMFAPREVNPLPREKHILLMPRTRNSHPKNREGR